MEDGVFRSADRGDSWSAGNFGLLDLAVLALALSPAFADDGLIVAGTESGVFVSTNGGRAWRETGFPAEHAPVLSLALSPASETDGTIFAGTDAAGLWSSADRGRTWARLDGGALAGGVEAIIPAPDYPADRSVLVLGGGALRVSRDGGRSWTPWPAGTAFEGSVAAVAAPHGLGPDAPLLVGLVGGGVRRL